MESNKEEAYERCVMCLKQTEYKKIDHIDFRNYYVEGSGQLCKDCYCKLYKGGLK